MFRFEEKKIIEAIAATKAKEEGILRILLTFPGGRKLAASAESHIQQLQEQRQRLESARVLVLGAES